MKKFMKGCAITALVMCVLGIILASLASSIKGRTAINEVVEKVTDGRVHVNLTGWGDWGITVGEQMKDAIDNVSYEIGDSISFDKNHEILKGNIEKYSLGSSVDSLDIEVGGCTFETVPSGDDSFYIEAKKAGKFQAYVEDNVLYVVETASSRNLNGIGDCKITLYVPEGCSFAAADIELGAGTLEFDELNASKAELSVGAGQIIVNGIKAVELDASIGMGQMHLMDICVENLDAEVGMGELIANGSIGSTAVIECSMGNVEMKIDGSQKDFNYEIEGAMGNIDIGKDSYSGFSQSKTVDNSAEKRIEVSGSMGNISLMFTE
ncbi:MAG: DUF4097 family beta strand repeat-containing protein [Acetatifactor sp.]